jgi:ketosteroid isomerase-like protein
MTHANTSAAQVVQAYYDILTGGPAAYDPARLRAILAADLMFEGPIAGHVVGAERFSKGVSGFIETMRSLTMVHQLYAGDTAATLYDAEMPGGTVRFAEFFHVQDGKIQTLTLLYDATEYRARGGR